MGEGADEGALECFQGFADGVWFKDPGGAEGGDGGEDLGPDDKFGFLVEVLEEREETWGGLVARGGEGRGVGEHACAVFDCEETVFCGATEFREAGRGVGGAVEAGMVGVEFVEGGIGVGIERNREVSFSGGEREGFVDAGFCA